MSARIPIGPYHPALEEPYKIEVVSDGERVVGADIEVGFNFRAIEWLASARTTPPTSLWWSVSAASAPTCTR